MNADRPTDGETSCPACGFELGEDPWLGGSPSHEICSSCGLQFGYQDMAAGGRRNDRFYDGWRASWLSHGAPWSGRASVRPSGWDPKEQVRSYLARRSDPE